MRPARPLLVIATAISATLLPAAAAAALSYPVTSTADTDAKGTLRKSIEEANADSGVDTIPIEVTGTIELGSALPPITGDVNIIGPGAGALTIRRSSAGGFRILDFSSEVTAASVSGLTVSNGLAESGGGIINGTGGLMLTDVVVEDNEAVAIGNPDTIATGGGIYSSGPLELRESVVRGNVARAGNGSNVAIGGGIATSDRVVILRSTIAGNLAVAELGGTAASAEGGGLYASGQLVVVERSTISGNTASAGSGGTLTTARGGGIETSSDAASLTGSTVTGNSVVVDSAGTEVAAGANLDAEETHVLRNTIVADPVGAESCGAPLFSGGFNLDEDSSCELGESTDLAAVDPLLGPLAANGGPTPTHALLPGSAAIDRGNSFGSTVDQRGFPRPVDFGIVSNTEGGDGSDIGAFELQALPSGDQPGPAPILVDVIAGDRDAPNTRIVSGPPRVSFKRLARFRFNSTESQSTFQCKVDTGQWRGCRSPFKRRVGGATGPGKKHVFKVRAIDRFGNVDPSPARFGWRVKKLSR